MKKVLLGMVMVVVLLVGCSPEADYTMNELETALMRGEYLSGKTALIEVKDIEMNPVLGYVIRSGQNMHFVSHVPPEVRIGDDILIEIISYGEVFGEFTVSYVEVE